MGRAARHVPKDSDGSHGRESQRICIKLYRGISHVAVISFRNEIVLFQNVSLVSLIYAVFVNASLRSLFILYPSLVSDLALDVSDQDKIRVNFNITMMDLKCEYAVVDVVSVLGTEQNVTAHVNKWHVDAEGIRQRFQGRNRAQHDIELFDSAITDSIEELHENGEDAVSLTETTFQLAVEQNEYVFLDFYANW